MAITYFLTKLWPIVFFVYNVDEYNSRGTFLQQLQKQILEFDEEDFNNMEDFFSSSNTQESNLPETIIDNDVYIPRRTGDVHPSGKYRFLLGAFLFVLIYIIDTEFVEYAIFEKKKINDAKSHVFTVLVVEKSNKKITKSIIMYSDS